MHLVVHVFALGVESLQDLRQHVDRLLAAQPGPLRLELLQEVFGGHRFPDQVPADRFLCQLHVAAGQNNTDVVTFASRCGTRGPPPPTERLTTDLELGVDLPDGGCGVLFPEGPGLWLLGSIFSLLAAGESVPGFCLFPVGTEER